jgi:segregation and condensation protein A
MQNYRIQLDTYSGPMDLLLYLIRREEVDIYDIPIAHVLGQYLEYVRLLEAMDPDGVGEFLVLAATLMEIKSRLLLPKPPPEEDDGDELDPRADLVRQLLAYRAFRDAASNLSDRAERRASQLGRPKIGLPEDAEREEVDIEDAQVWDLMTAFNKLLSSVGIKPGMHEVVYDDTPISLHALDIQDRLQREGPSIAFERVFEGRTRSEMVGLFLALLELIRQDRVRFDQDAQFGSITVHLIDATPLTEVHSNADHDAFKSYEELEEEAEAPAAEEEYEPVDVRAEAEPVFADEEDDDDEDDEYARQIDAVQITDVDLGRTLNETPDSGEDEQQDVDEHE